MKMLLNKAACQLKIVLVFTILGLQYGCHKVGAPIYQEERADVVFDWYRLQLRILLNANPATNNSTNVNNFGYIGVALHEAVQNGTKGSSSLSSRLYQMPKMPVAEMHKGYLWAECANAAIAATVRSLYVGLTDANKASIDSLENAYNSRFNIVCDQATFERSQAFGRAIAAAIFNWSKSDNFIVSNAGYVPPVFPGAWEPTPPAFTGAATPFVKDARPFLESNLTATAPPIPFTYSEDPNSDFYKMVKEVYDISKTSTDDQKTMALFWNDVGVGRGFTPAGHSLSVVTQALESDRAVLSKAAAVYAKTGIAIRDAIITLWKIKYFYNVVRPVTYIRKLIEPGWSSLIPNPSHPEYPSAHTYISGAVFRVLARELGDPAFTDNTYTFLGFSPRHYSSFEAVIDEVGNSRIYGGIHYRISVSVAKELGIKLGNKVADLNITRYDY